MEKLWWEVRYLYSVFKMKTGFSKQLHILFIFFILLVGVTIYARLLSYPFQFDDKINISLNPVVTDLNNFVDLSAAQKYQKRPGYPALANRYVGYLTFALNYAVDGFDVRGYHAVNLLIHISNALLLYWFVLVLFETPGLRASPLTSKAQLGALLAGMLFVVHPVQTQAVTYVVQRLASLATLFYLVALLSYLKSRLLLESRRARYGWFALSLAAAILGMKTKEIAFTLPLAAVLIEVCFLEGPWRNRLRWLIPLGFTMLIIPLTHLMLSSWKVEKAASIFEVNMPRLTYLLTECRVLVTYLRLWLIPVNQSLIYDYPTYESITAVPVICSAMVLAALLGFGGYLFYRGRKEDASLKVVAFGIFWFFLSLAVESTLVPLYPIYEHRMYLSSVGLSLSTVIGGMILFNRMTSRQGKRGLIIPVVLIMFFMGCLTLNRNSVWRNETALWQDTTQKAPGSLIATQNLADSYKSAKKFDRALVLCQKMLEMKPFKYYGARSDDYHRGIVFIMIGDIYTEKNNPQEAATYYEKATQTDVDKSYISYAFDQLGSIQMEKGNIYKAADYFKRSTLIFPSYNAYYNLGTIFIKTSRYKKAVYYLNEAIRIDATQEDAYSNLAAAYFMSGQYEKAVQVYQKILSMNPRQFKAFMDIAKTYLVLKDNKKAIMYLKKALALNPRDLGANILLEKAELGR